MKNFLIGSRALAVWDPSFPLNPDSDWDIVSTHPIEGSEHHSPDILCNTLVVCYMTPKTIDFNGHTLHVVSPKGLALIKRSHLHRPLSFSKHITHYHKHLVPHMANLDRFDRTFLEQRTLVTHREYPLRNPPLNRSKQDFFDDGIYRAYDHDYLHELVAHHDQPLYKSLQEPGDEIKCHQYLWTELSQKDRLLCVLEETYVTALERFLLVPNPLPLKLAFFKSLEKVCTTMTSGWFREFSIDYYPHIVSLFDHKKLTSIITYLGDQHDLRTT